MKKITDAITGLENCIAKDRRDRWVDHHIAEALGGNIRKVSRLGLNGRTSGSDRVFWPKHLFGKSSAIPYYTKDAASRTKAMAKLRAALDIALHGEP